MSKQFLLDYCDTDKEREIVQAYVQYDKREDAVIAAKSSLRNFSRILNRVRARAAVKETNMSGSRVILPPGLKLKRISKYYKDGVNTNGWVIAEQDKDAAAQIMEEAIEALSKDLGKYPPVALAQTNRSAMAEQLVNMVTLTDTHIGMYATGPRDEDNWDLNIAAETLTKVFVELLESAPQADTCVVSLLGDIFHCNGSKPVTPKSGHILDTDGEFEGAVDVAIYVLRVIIEKALTLHKKVVVSVIRGNHDEDQAIWLRRLLKAVYANEPRIEFLDGGYVFNCVRFDKVMLGFYHGDDKNLNSLPLYFATHYPKDWGEAEFREIHTGDKHHGKEFDMSGVTIKQHTTLISKDSYAKKHGYNSLRAAERITYHKDLGRCSTGTVTPEMVMLWN